MKINQMAFNGWGPKGLDSEKLRHLPDAAYLQRVELERQSPYIIAIAPPLRQAGVRHALPDLCVPSFTPSTRSPRSSRAASNEKKNKLLNDENVSEGQHHFGGWDGAPGGKFLLLPNPGSWQKQVEPSSFLPETQLSRWLRQGGERPRRNRLERGLCPGCLRAHVPQGNGI